MTDAMWARFLEHCAHARTKPSFDAEDRDWKIAVAPGIRQALEAARDGADWQPALEQALLSGRAHNLTVPAHRDWLAAWAGADRESLRAGLASFLERERAPEERFASFAAAAEAVAGSLDAEAARAGPAAVLALGSLFAFVVEPESLPIMRALHLNRVEELLGCPAPPDAPPPDLYRHHLAFMREAQARMEEARVDIRDMIDVQGLVFVAAMEHELWSKEPPPGWDELARRRLPPGAAYLAICAVYRDEAPYLREWVEFHRLAGVERFLLYDNLSSDAHREALAPYLADGSVILHEWPAFPPDQREVYDRCLAEHRDDARWIAFLDVDEFLFSPTGKPLPELLRSYERWPGVGVNWAAFGTSGHRTPPAGLVIESYLMRDRKAAGMMKSVVDPLRTTRCETPHGFVYTHGLAVDENCWPIHGTATRSSSLELLRINHYAARSVEEALAKQARAPTWSHLARWRARAIAGELDEERDELLLGRASAVREALARTARGERAVPDGAGPAPSRARTV